MKTSKDWKELAQLADIATETIVKEASRSATGGIMDNVPLKRTAFYQEVFPFVLTMIEREARMDARRAKRRPK